jgi:hypothetical protein
MSHHGLDEATTYTFLLGRNTAGISENSADASVYATTHPPTQPTYFDFHDRQLCYPTRMELSRFPELNGNTVFKSVGQCVFGTIPALEIPEINFTTNEIIDFGVINQS